MPIHNSYLLVTQSTSPFGVGLSVTLKFSCRRRNLIVGAFLEKTFTRRCFRAFNRLLMLLSLSMSDTGIIRSLVLTCKVDDIDCIVFYMTMTKCYTIHSSVKTSTFAFKTQD